MRESRLVNDARNLPRRQLAWVLVWALVFSFFPWTPSALSPAVQRAFDRAPEAVQWAAPLALSITGWADKALSAIGPLSVYAGDSITLTLSKRDDGPNVGAIPVGPDPVQIGDVLVYYVHITNTGVTTATVFFTDVLPFELHCLGAGVTPQNGGAGWFGACASGNTVVMRTLDSLGLGSGLGPGRNAVLYVQAQVLSGLTDGHIFTNAGSSYSAHATQEPQYVYSGLNDVNTTVRAPQLAITKTVSSDLVGVGDLLTYVITYSNPGSVNATGIVITDLLDLNVSYDSATPAPDAVGSSLVWNSLGDLAAGASGQITLYVRVNAGVPGETILGNSVSIGCDQGISASDGPVTATVKARTLRVTKSAFPAPVRAGERITYTLVFTNESLVATPSVYITDTLPAGVTDVAHSSSDAVFTGQVGNAYGWFVASMPADGVGTIELSMNAPTAPVAADGSTTLFNQVEITSTQASNAISSSLSSTVIPGPADVLTIVIAPTEQAVNNTAAIAVTVVDAYGNAVYNGDDYTVTLISDPATATFGDTTLNLVDGQGTTTILATDAGVYTVTAQVFGATVTGSAQVTFTPSVIDHFEIGPIASPQRAGVDFTIVVTAVDVYGNIVSNFHGSVPIQDGPEPDQMTPDVTGNFANGILMSQPVSITLVRANDPITVGVDVSATASNPFAVIGGLPATLTVQFAAPAAPLGQPAPFTVTVTDLWNNPVQSESLTLTVDAGSVTPATGATNGAGLAFGQVLSGTTPGWVTLLVTASNGVTGTGSVQFIAGCPATVTVMVSPASLTVDQSATITVEVTDQWDNPVSGAQVNLSAPGLGLGSITPAAVAVDGTGQATATIASTLVGVKTVGTQTVAAGGCTSVLASANVTFTHGAPFTLTLSMIPDPQVVGVPAALQANVTDQYGNAVPGQVVTFTATPGGLGGGSIDPLAATSDALGRAATAISSTLVGSTNVTAELASGAWRTAVVTFVVGPPYTVTMTVAPQTVYGEENATLTITMTDRYGNPSASYAVILDADPLGDGGIVPSSPTANASGVATAFISGTIPGLVYITGTAGSGLATTQMTVTNGSLAGFETSFVADVGVGVDFTLHITAVDAWGNTRTQDNYVVSLADLTGSLQPTAATLANGTATVVVSITTAMINDAISVWYPPRPSTISQTNYFTVTAASPFTVVLDYTTPISACTSTPITATVRDMYGNPIAGVPVTFTHGGVGSIVPATGTTGANGRAVTVLSSNLVGQASVQAQVAGVAPVLAVIDVEPGAPVVSLAASATSVPAGQTVALTMTVIDCGGNPVPGEPIAWTITSGPGYLTPDGAPVGGTTNAAGVITFTFASTQTGQASVAAGTTDGLAIDIVTITVSAGAPARIDLSATPSSISPGGATSTLIATVRDAYGNPAPDGELVQFTLAGPAGSILTPPSGSNVATSGGQAQATLTSGSDTGTATITVVSASDPTVSETIDVNIRSNTIFLPLVFKRYPIGDLEIATITAIPDGVDGSGHTLYEVRVAVRNNGPSPVVGGYWVDLYLNPSAPVGLNVLWHHVSIQGYAWYVSESLGVGDTLVLSTKVPRYPPDASAHYSYWPGDLGGLADPQLWAMVDSWGTLPDGAVQEADETNNILGPVSVP
ncbi:MAG: Ig-like domain-containing protein [Anaerolineae bacterium]|nr:Ig-like domain-containing protein [Anaerolineae bacterium]